MTMKARTQKQSLSHNPKRVETTSVLVGVTKNTNIVVENNDHGELGSLPNTLPKGEGIPQRDGVRGEGEIVSRHEKYTSKKAPNQHPRVIHSDM